MSLLRRPNQAVMRAPSDARAATAAASALDDAPGAAVPSDSSWLAGLFINRDFAVYTAGAFVSATGSWFQVVGLGWLVVSEGGRQAGFWLGLVGFASLIPVLLLGLVGGLLADLISRRRLLLITQLVNASVLLLLAYLTATGRATIGVILTFATVMGIISALTWPTWQAVINDMVEPRDLARAIALNSARFNLTRVVGPAVGGGLLTLIGPAWCFAANAATAFGVTGSLLSIRFRPRPQRSREGLRQALLGGLIYARETPRALTLLLATSALGVFGLPYNSFLPAFAKDILRAGPGGLGLLLTAVGVGALFGAVASGMAWAVEQRRLVLCGALALFGLADLLFSASHWLPLSLLMLSVLGFAMLLYLASANTMLQSEVPPAVLGRLMGIWVIVTSGTTPLGSLAIGALSAATGVQAAVGLGGVCCILSGAVLAFSRHIA
ncbi:MAG TPA: MFS transporter [Chloroflexota bacterium]|nr:MFS transporter [Chloroflexota bacterium]